MGRRSDLTVSQRRGVVSILMGREKPAEKLARRVGISEQTLYRCRDDLLTGGEAVLANGKGSVDPRDREIRALKQKVERRDQVIGESTITNRILEKRRRARTEYHTPTQLGLLERFHRTLKLEEVSWRLYDSPAHCRECPEEFRSRYNRRRPHWALIPEEGGNPLVPEEVYTGSRAIQIPRRQSWARGAYPGRSMEGRGHHPGDEAVCAKRLCAAGTRDGRGRAPPRQQHGRRV